MTIAEQVDPELAYEDVGAGTPVVLLHGLTFDRTTWRPIVERLHGAVRTIAIDLPAHGESLGDPAPWAGAAEQVHALLAVLGVERPVVVGHSMSGGIAGMYAARHPARGVVFVDSGPYVAPFAELVQRVELQLAGDGFGGVWEMFESTLGLDRIPEPARTLVMQSHVVRQDVVLGYWAELRRTDPGGLQASIDAEILARLTMPCLAIFGRDMTDAERVRLARLPDVEVDEHDGDGHFVHLVDADRFAERLLRFVERCREGQVAG